MLSRGWGEIFLPVSSWILAYRCLIKKKCGYMQFLAWFLWSVMVFIWDEKALCSMDWNWHPVSLPCAGVATCRHSAAMHMNTVCHAAWILHGCVIFSDQVQILSLNRPVLHCVLNGCWLWCKDSIGCCVKDKACQTINFWWVVTICFCSGHVVGILSPTAGHLKRIC